MSAQRKPSKKENRLDAEEALTPEIQFDEPMSEHGEVAVVEAQTETDVTTAQDKKSIMQPEKTGNAILDMINMALVNDLDIDKLNRLWEMHERWEAKEATKAFANDYAKAKAEMAPVVARHEANFGAGKAKFKHEKLQDLQAAVDPALTKYGFSYRWKLEQTDNFQRVIFVLKHKSGHEEETPMQGPPDKSGNKTEYHALSSANTFMQRLTMRAGLGLAVSYDDNAESFESDDTISPEQEEILYGMLKNAGINEKLFFNQYKIEKYGDLPAKLYDDAVKRIKAHNRIKEEGR